MTKKKSESKKNGLKYLPIFVICSLLLIGFTIYANISPNKEIPLSENQLSENQLSENQLSEDQYEGPIQQGFDEPHFRATGETIPLEVEK